MKLKEKFDNLFINNTGIHEIWSFWKWYIILFIALIVIGMLTSCGRATPIIGLESDPYVVKNILQEKDLYGRTSYCRYIGSSRDSGRDQAFLGAQRPEICLPCGLYQIGDTIKPMDFK